MVARRDVFAGGQEVRGVPARAGPASAVPVQGCLCPFGYRRVARWPRAGERLPANAMCVVLMAVPVRPGSAGWVARRPVRVAGAALKWRAVAQDQRLAQAPGQWLGRPGGAPALRRQGSGSGRCFRNVLAGSAAHGGVPGDGHLMSPGIQPRSWRPAGGPRGHLLNGPGRQRAGLSADSADDSASPQPSSAVKI
jgi:hypothetical protein